MAPEGIPDDAEAFRCVNLLVHGKVRRLRSDGKPDDEIREAVLASMTDRSPNPIAGEYRRERWTSWVQNTLADALAAPPEEELDEFQRRLPNWAEGRWVELADGRRWSFPVLSLDFQAETLGAQDITKLWLLRYDWGPKLYLALVGMRTYAAGGDLLLASGQILAAASALLQSHYRLTDDECRRLMPIVANDPVCAGELLAAQPDVLLTSFLHDRRIWSQLGQKLGESLASMTGEIVKTLPGVDIMGEERF